jgi:hypothetical protein
VKGRGWNREVGARPESQYGKPTHSNVEPGCLAKAPKRRKNCDRFVQPQGLPSQGRVTHFTDTAGQSVDHLSVFPCLSEEQFFPGTPPLRRKKKEVKRTCFNVSCSFLHGSQLHLF